MSTVHPSRLMSLADREFRREATAPKPKRPARAFKAMNLTLSRFDSSSWDRKRGSAARRTGILLRENAEALHARVCADEKATKTYDEAAVWLQSEARCLRKLAAMQETAAGRLAAVLDRCREERRQKVPAIQV